MKVTTAYPVYIDGKRISENNDWISDEDFSYLPDTPAGATTPTPTAAEQATAATKGLQWDKVKGWIQKGAEVGKSTGIFDWVGNQLGIGKKKKTEPAPAPAPVSTKPPKAEGGMSTKTMLLIGGGVLAVGALVYFATRGNNKTATK